MLVIKTLVNIIIMLFKCKMIDLFAGLGYMLCFVLSEATYSSASLIFIPQWKSMNQPKLIELILFTFFCSWPSLITISAARANPYLGSFSLHSVIVRVCTNGLPINSSATLQFWNNTRQIEGWCIYIMTVNILAKEFLMVLLSSVGLSKSEKCLAKKLRYNVYGENTLG